MQKRPFPKIIACPVGAADYKFELRRPALTDAHAAEMFALLVRNDFFYPKRLSLRNCKSPADCKSLVERRLAAISAMTDSYYDIFSGASYVGEIYARDIDYDASRVGNLGYFMDKDAQNRGLATAAVNSLTDEMLGVGAQEICLFVHFFDANELNLASERVAIKCGYEFAGTKEKALFDETLGWAAEHMFIKRPDSQR